MADRAMQQEEATLQVFVLLTALLEVPGVRRAPDEILGQSHDRTEGVGVVSVELREEGRWGGGGGGCGRR